MEYRVGHPIAYGRMSDQDGMFALFSVHAGDALVFSVRYWFSRFDAISLGIGEFGPGGQMNELLLHYGIVDIETGLCSGAFPPLNGNSIVVIQVGAEQLKRLEAEIDERQCQYQEQRGRDLFCTGREHELPSGRMSVDRIVEVVGRRDVVATTRPLCRRCDLPDQRFACAHLMHTSVFATKDADGRLMRAIADKMCDRGRREVDNAADCTISGHGCWERLIEVDAGPVHELPALALNEALDHLADTWRIAFGQKLLRVRSTAQAAMLSHACATRSDFESRLSALTDLLKLMAIPDSLLAETDRAIDKSHTFNRLMAAINKRVSDGLLDESERDRISAAIGSLRKTNDMRNAFQHSGGRKSAAMAAWAHFGLRFPPSSWALAWSRMRSSLVDSLRTIREALQTSIQ